MFVNEHQDRVPTAPSRPKAFSPPWAVRGRINLTESICNDHRLTSTPASLALVFTSRSSWIQPKRSFTEEHQTLKVTFEC